MAEPEAVSVGTGTEPAAGWLTRVRRSPALSVFEIRDYRYYWAASFTYFIVFGAQRFVFVLLVLELTDSAGLGGVTGFALGIPAFFISLPAGVWADSMDRRRLVMFANLGGAAAVLVVATLAWTGVLGVSLTLLLALAAGAAAATAQPALTAIVPSIVPRERLMNAIVLRTVGQNLAMVIGSVIGGGAIALIGFGGAFALQSALFLVVALLMMTVRAPVPVQAPDAPGMWGRVAEGLRFLFRDRALRALVVLLAVSGLFMLGPAFVLVQEIARTKLGVGPFQNSLLFAITGAGMLLVSVVLASLPRLERKGYWFLLNTLLAGPFLIGMAWSQWYPVTALFMFLWGAGGGVFVNLNMTLLQSNTPDRMMGRVMSISVLSIAGLIPLGSLLAGAGAEVVGADWYLGFSGAVLLVAVAAIFATSRELRAMD